MREKICENCGSRMIYNELLERWECNMCENCEELNALFGFNRFMSRI